MFSLFKSTPKKFVAHCLDPEKGYHTKTITPSTEADAKALAQMADGENLYFLYYFEEGEKIEQIVPASKKDVWYQLKNQHY